MLERVLKGNIINACSVLLQRFASGHIQKTLGHLGSWSEPGRAFHVSLCYFGKHVVIEVLYSSPASSFFLGTVPCHAQDQYEHSAYSPYNAFSKALKLSIAWLPTLTQEATTNSVPLDYSYFCFHLFWLVAITYLL